MKIPLKTIEIPLNPIKNPLKNPIKNPSKTHWKNHQPWFSAQALRWCDWYDLEKCPLKDPLKGPHWSYGPKDLQGGAPGR